MLWVLPLLQRVLVQRLTPLMQFYCVQRLQNKPNTCILKLLFVVLVIYRDIELLELLKPLLSSRSPAGFFLP